MSVGRSLLEWFKKEKKYPFKCNEIAYIIAVQYWRYIRFLESWSTTVSSILAQSTETGCHNGTNNHSLIRIKWLIGQLYVSHV